MSEPPSASRPYDVAGIGRGLMGSALARAFAEAGDAVTTCNRAPERAEALADAGIAPLRSLDAAVGSAGPGALGLSAQTRLPGARPEGEV